MIKLMKLGLAIAVFATCSQVAWADEEPVVQPHLFDDLNANTVSDSVEATQDNGNQTPSTLTDDAEQAPYYPPADSEPN